MLMLVIVLASTSVPRLVYASTSEIFDANDTTPAYLDIVHAKVTDQVGTGQISFMMELAEAVPNPPETGTFVAYNWQLDTDPSLAGIEFIIVVRWLYDHWETYVLDQRAFNQGTGDLVQVFLTDEVAFHGATEHITIDAALLGDPTSFRWRSLTRDAPAPAPFKDQAPDSSGWVDFSR